jgi:hypothetical protein
VELFPRLSLVDIAVYADGSVGRRLSMDFVTRESLTTNFRGRTAAMAEGRGRKSRQFVVRFTW